MSFVGSNRYDFEIALKTVQHAKNTDPTKTRSKNNNGKQSGAVMASKSANDFCASRFVYATFDPPFKLSRVHPFFDKTF